MDLEVISKYLARALFLLAAAIFVVAFVEWLAQIFGSSIVGQFYSAGRLLELAATLLVFVIAVLLRQIRNELRSGRNT